MSEPHFARAFFSLRSGLCAGLLALLLGGTPDSHAAPINDDCTGAEVIPATSFSRVTSIQDITFATTNADPVPPSCYQYDPANLLRSVWYSFTPAISGRYSISTCTAAPTATTVPDTVMAVYTSATGCGGIMVEVSGGCSDDSGGVCALQSSVGVQLRAGTRYYIVVWRYGADAPTPDSSSLQLFIDFAVPPVNDDCDNAITLSLNQPVRGSTVFAFNDYQLDTNCFVGAGHHLSTAGGPDVVYSF